ncbi:MAG: hypothetical protein RL768_873 [Nitrospirota bacterium]
MLFEPTQLLPGRKKRLRKGSPLQKRYSAFTRKTTVLLAPTCPTCDSGEFASYPMNSRLLFSLTLPLLLLSGTLALRSNHLHPDQQHDRSTDPCQHTPHPHRRSRPVNDASRSEINLDLTLTLKILRIELNFMMLLLALYLYKKRIT